MVAPRHRAFELLRDDKLLAYVGEGGGPFVIAAHSVLPYQHFETARVTSLSVMVEQLLHEIVAGAGSFAEVCDTLGRLGFRLREVAYDDVFAPLARAPRMDPRSGGGRRHK